MIFAISTVLVLLPCLSMAFSLPPPPGDYNVTMQSGVLADHSRDNRALMLSVFQPATCRSTIEVPYMPNATAAYQGDFLKTRFDMDMDLSAIFLGAQLPVCEADTPNRRHARDCKPIDDKDLPVILLASGWSFPRGYYSILASAIASNGFTVMTIDHPDEANIITYPNGTSVTHVTPEPDSLEDILPYLAPRIADTTFIIDQLSNATAMAEFLPARGEKPFPVDKIALMGHSLGGVASVYVAAQDTRIRAAIDWDQQIFGPPLESNSTTPVLFFNRPNSTEPNWLDSWPQIQGPMLWVEVANTTHQTFCDAPTLLKAAGEDTAPLADLLGTIDATRALQIQVDYATEWVKSAFEGKVGGPLLEGEEAEEYPEVKVIERRGF